jgi:hypothetical protein
VASGTFDGNEHEHGEREPDTEPIGLADSELFATAEAEPFGVLPDEDPFGGESAFDGEFDASDSDEAGRLDDDSPRTGLPPKVEAWRQRSAMGAILTGFALGLQQALEPRRDEPSIVVQSSGEPPTDLPVEANFEFRRPRESVVNVRPWLLNGSPDDLAAGATPKPDDDPIGP